MSESKVQQHVAELMKTLGGSEKLNDLTSCEVYTNVLLKNRAQQSTVKAYSVSALSKLMETSRYPDGFREKYEDLKMKSTPLLDPTICLVSKIQSNGEVQNFLKKDYLNKCREKESAVNDKSNLSDNSNLSLVGNVSQKDIHMYQKQILPGNHLSLNKSFPEKRKVPQGIYPLSSWTKERPYLSWDFVADERSDFTISGPIGVLPPNVQESRLIDDILFCLVGIEGDYIHSEKLSNIEAKKLFHIDDSANVALKSLVQNILPMFSHYSTIVQFVEENIQYEKGLVNHALSASMRTFLKDYFVLISQLENQHLQCNLTLQKLWFYLQPSFTTLETIAGIASTLKEQNCFGGTVLSFLHETTSSLTGSSKAREISHALTRAASLPYFEILEKWIYKGIISDYYSEFLVEDNELIKKEDLPTEYSDAYWEKRYTIRRDQIPTFLIKAADMILRTGKYLNVIRQCGKTVSCPDAKTIVYTMRESQYIEYIEPAYHFASKKLLDLLMDDADLKRRLLSVKHYFLLDQGDFIVQFMDMAEEELQKGIDDIMPTRLESLLELALRTSVVNEDKYKDDVRIELHPYDLLTQMFKILNVVHKDTSDYTLTGLEAFAFDYDVKWPLSLVINRKALAYYQILFRHLFYCKHIENLLGQAWLINKKTKSLNRSEICFFAPAFALRQRMLNFIQNLDYYLTLEVIEPHWNDFFRKISQVTNIDEVLDCHNDFLEKCVDDCMLTNPDLLKILASLMKLCADFSTYVQGFMKSFMELEVCVMNESLSHSVYQYKKLPDCPETLKSFQDQTTHHEKKFDESIVCMLKILHTVNQSKQTSKIINMLYRLDFSRFYEEMRHKDLESLDDV